MTGQEKAFVYAGTVERLFSAETNNYGYFVNTAGEAGDTYLLELGDTSAPASVSSDGYRVFSVACKDKERGTDYVVTFDAAKTAKKTIMLREAWEIFDDEDETGEPFGFSQYQSTEGSEGMSDNLLEVKQAVAGTRR